MFQDLDGEWWDTDCLGNPYPTWVSKDTRGDEQPDDLSFHCDSDGVISLTANNKTGPSPRDWDQTTTVLDKGDARELALQILKATGGRPDDREWNGVRTTPVVDEDHHNG